MGNIFQSKRSNQCSGFINEEIKHKMEESMIKVHYFIDEDTTN